MRPALAIIVSWLIPLFCSAQKGSQNSAAAIYERTYASVVVVIVADRNGKPIGQASGFIVAKDRIATNHHVVDGASRALIAFADGATEIVEGVVADSPVRDLAILAVKTGSRSPLRLGDELSVRQGDLVYALGAPRGLESSLTNGIVSGFRNVEEQFLIQTTAPIAPGSSGGPLLDNSGREIGVTTSSIGDSPGIYFSVGASDVKRLLRTPNLIAIPLSAAWSRAEGAAPKSGAEKTVDEESNRSSEKEPSESSNLPQPPAEEPTYITKIWKNTRDGRMYRTRSNGNGVYLESLDDPLKRKSDITSCEFHRAVSIGLNWVGDCWERNPKDQSTYGSTAMLTVFSETRIEGSTSYIPKFVMIPASTAAEQELARGLYLTSEPPGADVFINGVKMSEQTPVTLPLVAGQYNLALRLAGYDPYVCSVQVKDNIQTQLHVTLTERDQSRIAFAEVRSKPVGAEIFIDGNSTGKFTPSRVRLPSGLHLVMLKLNGFQRVERTVQASEGSTVTVEETLKPN